MKSFPKVGTPLETVLFPKYKIRPYLVETPEELERVNIMANPKKTLERVRSRLHLLEVTEPQLLLQKIFHPYLLLVKILGCQPLIIENGCAKFNYFSWNVAYSLLVFGLFIFDTAFFLPIMKHMNSKREANFIMYVTEIILVTCQISAAQMSYIFIAVQAKKLTSFWNRLQIVLVKLVARCPNHLDLLPSYRSARMKIIVWLMFTIVFGTCYITSFQDDIRAYLKKQNYNNFYYWTMFTGFAFYSVMLSIHILHTTCFTTFVCVLCSCFQTLGNIAVKQDGQGTMRNSQSPVLFQETSAIYEELMELKNLLGGIYGIYMALEILAMIICTTINCYFLISHHNHFSLCLLNAAIAMPYVIWFHKLCGAGGELHASMKQCYRNFRKAVVCAGKKVSVTELVHLQIEAPDCLSASGYFMIDMRLFTTVMGTIATYLVVMLQFGAGMENNGGLHSLMSIRAASDKNSSGNDSFGFGLN